MLSVALTNKRIARLGYISMPYIILSVAATENDGWQHNERIKAENL